MASPADRQSIGERLRVARAAAGLTQEQVAERVSMARTTLVAIERGDRPARPEELVALAAAYGVGVNALVRPSAIRVDIVGQFRRSGRPSAGDLEGTRAIQLLHDLAAGYAELESRLDRVSKPDYPPERKLGRGRLDQQAQELAQELRARLGLGLAPVPEIVSLFELEFGLRLFLRPLHSSIAGVYAFNDAFGACVLVNALHPRTRRRWTVSHEIGHFLTSRAEPDVARIGVGKSPNDIFADAFAAAFLMPSATVRRIFDEYVGAEGKFSARHIVLGSHRLGVSVEAFARRLEELEMVLQGTYDSLRDRGLDDRVVRGILGPIHDDTPSESTSRVMILAAEAHERGIFSEGQLADMLGLTRVDLRRVIDGLAEADFTNPSGPRGAP